MGLNSYVDGGQLHLFIPMHVPGARAEVTWFSPEEVARFTARAWAQGARDAVHAGAAASLCVDGILPRDSTKVH